MKCIIIGDGPSKSLVKNVKFDFDVFCVHYTDRNDCKAVFSLDLTQYNRKEKTALDKGIQLILGENSCFGDLKNSLKNQGAIFFNATRMRGNSGLFAIEWAIAHGYKEIYTAGIDFYCDEYEYMKQYTIDAVNKYIIEMINKGISIYKYSASSKLDCPVKTVCK